eukprot:404966-Prymnesium_polylepis.1
MVAVAATVVAAVEAPVTVAVALAGTVVLAEAKATEAEPSSNMWSTPLPGKRWKHLRSCRSCRQRHSRRETLFSAMASASIL